MKKTIRKLIAEVKTGVGLDSKRWKVSFCSYSLVQAWGRVNKRKRYYCLSLGQVSNMWPWYFLTWPCSLFWLMDLANLESNNGRYLWSNAVHWVALILPFNHNIVRPFSKKRFCNNKENFIRFECQFHRGIKCVMFVQIKAKVKTWNAAKQRRFLNQS